jgi:hypothetical protein
MKLRNNCTSKSTSQCSAWNKARNLENIYTKIGEKVMWSGRWQVHSLNLPTTKYIQPIHDALLTLVSLGGMTFWLVCPFGMRSGFNDNRASISIWNKQKSYTMQSRATGVKLHKKYNVYRHPWFQTFAMFWMLYAFFWIIPRLLNFMCRRFVTHCSIFIGG